MPFNLKFIFSSTCWSNLHRIIYYLRSASGLMRILIVILSIVSIFPCRGGNLKAYFSYCTFTSPETGPYVETYLSVIGSSIGYRQLDSISFQGSVEVTVVFKQGEEIRNFKKYNLMSPVITDTLLGTVNFLDQQRYSLSNGEYELELRISDFNNNDVPFEHVQPFSINYPTDKIAISDIELFESYKRSSEPGPLTKSGYDLVPYVANFYPPGMSKISFYAEVYNTGAVLGGDEGYLINYLIEDADSEDLVKDIRGFKRQTASDVNVILGELNIEELPSGNFNLVVEVRSRTNEILEKKRLFIQRSNPSQDIRVEDVADVEMEGSFVDKITGRDTISEYIKSIRPISSPLEMSFADQRIGSAGIDVLKKFFLSFWRSRDEFDPESEWEKYKLELRKVDKAFSTKIKKGHETDRGVVYLKHGPPNTRAERNNEPGAYPYEIWHYYKLKKFSNIKFIFYNPDLVTNDYQLLHSNLRGEINDYRWQQRLYKRDTQDPDIDGTGGQDRWGGRADEFFQLPR